MKACAVSYQAAKSSGPIVLLFATASWTLMSPGHVSTISVTLCPHLTAPPALNSLSYNMRAAG